MAQTDRDELAPCRRNVVGAIEHPQADWTAWGDIGRCDGMIGANIHPGRSFCPHLRRTSESHVASGCPVADPFRGADLPCGRLRGAD